MSKKTDQENWLILESQANQVAKAREVLDKLKIKESSEDRVDLYLGDKFNTIIGISKLAYDELKAELKTDKKVLKQYKLKYNLK